MMKLSERLRFFFPYCNHKAHSHKQNTDVQIISIRLAGGIGLLLKESNTSHNLQIELGCFCFGVCDGFNYICRTQAFCNYVILFYLSFANLRVARNALPSDEEWPIHDLYHMCIFPLWEWFLALEIGISVKHLSWKTKSILVLQMNPVNFQHLSFDNIAKFCIVMSKQITHSWVS